MNNEFLRFPILVTTYTTSSGPCHTNVLNFERLIDANNAYNSLLENQNQHSAAAYQRIIEKLY